MTSAHGAERVVLVHGAVERASGFDEVVAHLTGLNVVTYDRRGHGARWIEGPTTLADDIDELVALLDEAPATVVGHSLGGLVAMGACVRCPRQVRSLGLYETAVPWGEWWTDEARSAMLAATEANAVAADESDAEDHERLAVAWASCLREVRDALDAPYRWQDVDAPLVTGRGSPLRQPSSRDAARLAHELGGTLVVLEGAGHRAHRTDPAGFAELVRTTTRLATG